MRVRTFTVPFAKIVGEDAHELDFGPEDRVVVRPLFGLSKAAIEAWAARIAEVEKAGTRAAALKASEDSEVDDETSLVKAVKDAEEMADRLIIDLLSEGVIEWHLEGPDGPIGKPGTPEALNALPAAIARSIFNFLTSYRGEAPGNPTIPR